MYNEEKYSKMLGELVIFWENKHPDFFNQLRKHLDTGDKIANIINLFEDTRKYRKTNSTWCAIIVYWASFHYCNRDEFFNFQRTYNDWKIDNKSGIVAENAAENQKTILQHLLSVGSLESTDLLGILSAKKKKDIIYNTKRRSTEILAINLSEIEYEQLINESIKPPEQTLLLEKGQAKSDKLRSELDRYNFFELVSVNQISTENQTKLVELISSKKIPYAIAMFDFLGFLKYLEKEYFPLKYKLNIEISKWLNSDSRTIKGNISSLLKNTTENKRRYTAHLHNETVVNDYQNLK